MARELKSFGTSPENLLADKDTFVVLRAPCPECEGRTVVQHPKWDYLEIDCRACGTMGWRESQIRLSDLIKHVAERAKGDE